MRGQKHLTGCCLTRNGKEIMEKGKLDNKINIEENSFPTAKVVGVEAKVGMPSENPFGQWISVKDKFPDEDIPVLVRVKKPLGEVGRYTVNRWTSYTDQNKEWFNKHFSHWMPLPKF